MQLPSSSLKNPSSQFSHLTPEYPTLQVQAPSLSVQLADSDPTQSQLHSKEKYNHIELFGDFQVNK